MSEVPSTPASATPATHSPAIVAARLALPHTGLSLRIDRILTRIGDATSWLWLVLIAVIVINVVLRHLFGAGRIELEELQWHIYAVGFLAALSYCMQADAHVRIDVVHERLRARWQAWIELYGLLLLLVPFTALIFVYSVPFVADSFARGEISQSPGGLPYRWLIKAALLVGFGMLALSTLSRLLRVWTFLFRDAAQPDHPAHPSHPRESDR